MDHELLVDQKIEDGKFLITGLVRQGFDVTIAFWARTSEEGLWFFYIGSASVHAIGLADAYRAVYGILQQLPHTEISISISSIKIIEADTPVAKDAIMVRDRYPARLPTRYQGKRLGNMAIEEAYIYPPMGPMTRQEILQTVTGLMNRSGILAPSLVTLRDGTQIEAIPVGVQLNHPGPMTVVFHDLVASSDRSISVDDVVNIM